MKIHDPRQLSFQFGCRPSRRPPSHWRPLTIANCRRILHAAQVMQLNTARPARELYALGRVEVWMRGMIRERA
jgi:hypothetical protein